MAAEGANGSCAGADGCTRHGAWVGAPKPISVGGVAARPVGGFGGASVMLEVLEEIWSVRARRAVLAVLELVNPQRLKSSTSLPQPGLQAPPVHPWWPLRLLCSVLPMAQT